MLNVKTILSHDREEVHGLSKLHDQCNQLCDQCYQLCVCVCRQCSELWELWSEVECNSECSARVHVVEGQPDSCQSPPKEATPRCSKLRTIQEGGGAGVERRARSMRKCQDQDPRQSRQSRVPRWSRRNRSPPGHSRQDWSPPGRNRQNWSPPGLSRRDSSPPGWSR